MIASDPSKKTILICEDENGVREAYKLVLEDFFNLHFVYNGLEAVEALKNLKTDAMICDIKMPKQNGLETLRKVKKMRPKLPVVIITGYQGDEIEREVIKSGASHFISKPFDSKQLLALMTKLANQS